jgi:hypothetical protein
VSLVTREPHLMTVPKAFDTFAFRLQLKDDEAQEAELRQRAVMMTLPKWFAVERSFYDGSFARHTFAKPISADLFVQLGYRNRGYRLRPPSAIIRAFGNFLARGIPLLQEETGCLVIGSGPWRRPIERINIVPIFADGDGWAIPDRHADRWLITDPHKHTELALRAHNEFAKRWRPVIQMIKCWNHHHGQPIKPAFLLEVIALDYLTPEMHSSYDLQVYGFFEELSKRLMETWPDRAGIGPAVSDAMAPEERQRAVELAERARFKCRLAIGAAREDIDKALAIYRELFGPLFPLD